MPACSTAAHLEGRDDHRLIFPSGQAVIPDDLACPKVLTGDLAVEHDVVAQ